MRDEQLHPWRRFTWVLTGLIGFVSFCGFFITFVESAEALPFLLRLCFLVMALYGLGLSALSFYVVKKGRFHVRKDTNMMIGIFLFHVILMLFIFLMLNAHLHDPEKGRPVILHAGLFILIVAVVAFLRYFEKSKDLVDEGLTDENGEIAGLESLQINRGKKK